MKNYRARGLGLYFLLFGIITSFSFCSGPESPLTKMEPPIRVIRNDTVTEVEDNNGRIYTLNTFERADYAVAFLALGDTLTGL